MHGIRQDPDKVHTVSNWLMPKSMKHVRSFLGLTTYYRMFVRQYALIATPLTNLLRKEGFVWSSEAQKAFEQLKLTLTSAPVLVFIDFTVPFIVETDTCGVGIEAVLLQLEHPIAYFSKKLSLRRQHATTYSKELWALTEVVHKWRHYLLGSEFVIRTDHCSLKNLLGQVIQSPKQQYFLTRLLGFSFTIVYKWGKENTMENALSQLLEIDQEESTQMTALTSSFQTNWADLMLQKNQSDPWICNKIEKLESGDFDPGYEVKGEILFSRNRFYLGPDSMLRQRVLEELHSSRTGGHANYFQTLNRVCHCFF